MQHHRMNARPALMAMLAAALALVAGGANAADKRFGLASFDRIILNADFVVEVVDASPVGAVASGTTAALDRVEMVANGGVLTIGDRQFAGGRSSGRASQSGDGVTIRVRARGLRGATVVGAGSMTIDRLRGARVDLALRGPGTLTVRRAEADRLNIAMIGNGQMAVAGTTKSAEAVVSGAGSIDAAGLAAADLSLDSEGAGDHVFQASRTAKLTARGTGRVAVTGRPACTIRRLGNATVTCGGS